MISEKYKQSLVRYEGKEGMVMYWCILFIPCFLVVMGALNTWQAIRIGSAFDFSPGDYFRVWFEDIEVNREYTYSGSFLLGMERFHTAILHFSFAIITALLAWGAVLSRRINREIVNALSRHGEF